MTNKELKITSVEEVKRAATPVVELPPFDNGTPFNARLRKANLFSLMIGGKIPNDLLSVASKAMDKGMDPASFEEMELPELGKLLEVMCAAVLVEPKWEDVKDYLTEEQVNAIMIYGTSGVRALENFRQQSGEFVENSGDSQDVGSNTE